MARSARISLCRLKRNRIATNKVLTLRRNGSMLRLTPPPKSFNFPRRLLNRISEGAPDDLRSPSFSAVGSVGESGYPSYSFSCVLRPGFVSALLRISQTVGARATRDATEARAGESNAALMPEGNGYTYSRSITIDPQHRSI